MLCGWSTPSDAPVGWSNGFGNPHLPHISDGGLVGAVQSHFCNCLTSTSWHSHPLHTGIGLALVFHSWHNYHLSLSHVNNKVQDYGCFPGDTVWFSMTVSFSLCLRAQPFGTTLTHLISDVIGWLINTWQETFLSDHKSTFGVTTSCCVTTHTHRRTTTAIMAKGQRAKAMSVLLLSLSLCQSCQVAQ